MLEELRGQLKTAMLNKDALRTSVLRMLLTAVKNEAIQFKKDDLTEAEFLTVVKRQAKQRKDSIDAFTQGGKPEMAENEKQELAILEEYLPEMISPEEIQKVVQAKKEELGITDASGMGRLMGAVMQELKDQADGAMVKDVVQKVLN